MNVIKMIIYEKFELIKNIMNQKSKIYLSVI